MGRLRKDPQCISRRHCFDALHAIYSFILNTMIIYTRQEATQPQHSSTPPISIHFKDSSS